MIKDKSGYSQVVVLIIIGVILVVLVLVGLKGFNGLSENFFKSAGASPSPRSSASSKISNEDQAKQQMYDQNKDKIKSDLNLNEKQFQILKQYSSN